MMVEDTAVEMRSLFSVVMIESQSGRASGSTRKQKKAGKFAVKGSRVRVVTSQA